jgi:hypothetical protein
MRRISLPLTCMMLLSGFACSSPSGGNGVGGAANTGGAGGTGGAAGATGGSGATGGAGGANSDGGLTPEQACVDWADALCRKDNECLNGYFATWYGDNDACVKSMVATGCNIKLGAPGSADTPATLAACAAGRRSASCAEVYENEVVACFAQRGQLGNGARCVTQSQCQSQYCAIPFGAECGICTPLIQAGGACTGAPGECAGSLTCVGGVCGRLPDLGEACSPDVGCRFGLRCLSGRCAPPPAAGESCATVACGRYLVCRNGVCEPWQYTTPGERCDVQAGPQCGRSGSCQKPDGSTSGVCIAPVAEGQACDDLYGPYCLPWLHCNQGVCKVPSATACK